VRSRPSIPSFPLYLWSSGALPRLCASTTATQTGNLHRTLWKEVPQIRKGCQPSLPRQSIPQVACACALFWDLLFLLCRVTSCARWGYYLFKASFYLVPTCGSPLSSYSVSFALSHSVFFSLPLSLHFLLLRTQVLWGFQT